MTIVEYPTLSKKEIDRQGKIYIECDVANCDAEAEVTDVLEHNTRRGIVREADMPKGWSTSDPDDNALTGAAQFCPKHSSRIYVPDDAAATTVVTNG